MNPEDLKNSLPPNLSRAVSGCVWKQNKIGLSAAQVFQLHSKNKSSLYLKIDSRTSRRSLLQEKLKLEWLENRLPVPEVRLFAEDETNEYLLLSEIPGVAASDDSLKKNIPETIRQLAGGLKMIHEIPVENCPFDARLARKIQFARERMIIGLVDEEDFDENRLGRSAEDLFRELITSVPLEEDLVFTHGDYCAPNIILKDEKLSGFVDQASAGVADRFQDLTLLSRSVRYNFGGEWEASVFEFYGVEPNPNKIEFYRLLDEFF